VLCKTVLEALFYEAKRIQIHRLQKLEGLLWIVSLDTFRGRRLVTRFLFRKYALS